MRKIDTHARTQLLQKLPRRTRTRNGDVDPQRHNNKASFRSSKERRGLNFPLVSQKETADQRATTYVFVISDTNMGAGEFDTDIRNGLYD